jgi:hypothetical protein
MALEELSEGVGPWLAAEPLIRPESGSDEGMTGSLQFAPGDAGAKAVPSRPFGVYARLGTQFIKKIRIIE